MKKLFCILIALLVPYFLVAQTVLWQEDFNSQVDKGVSGDGNGGFITDFTDINWTLDYSACSFDAIDDFVKVDSYFSGGRFEARDCNGEAIWESEAIDISSYENVQITATIGETGSSNNASAKYIRLYSVIDENETLFISNGEGLGNFGSATASSVTSSGNILKIRIKIRSDYAQDVYFDDIKVEGTPATPTANDTDSQVLSADSPIEDQTLIIANATATPQEVFKFKITDAGSADGKPTKLTQVILKKAVANTLDWENEIAEATLHTGTASTTAAITTGALTFTIPEESMQIEDGTSATFVLKLKTTKVISDNTKFQIQITAAHGFTASSTGSTFKSTLPVPIISGITTFDSKATVLQFKTQPSDTPIHENITPAIEVEVVDQNGNRDEDYSANITLTGANISGTTTLNATNGVATFSAIMFTSVATDVTITASSGTLSNVVSTAFDVADIINKTSMIESSSAAVTETIFPNETQAVFPFTIADKGGDDYATRVSQLVIIPAANNQLRWSEVLKTAHLKVKGVAIPTTTQITDAGIRFYFSENALTVAEGTTKQLTLYVQFAASKIEEGKVLAFQIPAENHKTKTSNDASSSFAENFEKAIVSKKIQTQVEATQLVILSQPEQEVAGTAFATPIVAQLQDNYGNTDRDTTVSATLSVETGTGELSPPTSLLESTLNGTFQWQNLRYNRVETAVFQIQAGDFQVSTASITFTTASSSLIVKSEQPIANDTIRSISNTVEKAKDFFKFSVQDLGDDGLPTIIEKLRFVKGNTFSQPRLYYLIGGIILKQNDVVIGRIDKLNSSNGYNDVEILLNTPLEIADGEAIEIIASIYLSKHRKLKEGEEIQLAIEEEHGWIISHAGTGIKSPLVSPVESAVFKIEVQASRLAFEEVPQNIEPGTTFTVTVAAVDENGIADTNYSGTVALSREAGTGKLSSDSDFTLRFTNGKATWSDLTYDTGESFTLLATSENFAPTESAAINASDADSEIQNSTSQILAGVLAATVTSETDAQAVFTFAVEDKGTNDNRPTILKKITFKNTYPAKGANWKRNIAGAVLLQNKVPVASTNDITEEAITFSNSKGVLSISDGITENVTLAIYLKYNNIEDNNVFQFKIAATDTDFTTDKTGSALQELNTDIISNLTTLQVTATQVDFLEMPYSLSTATATFSVTVGARDTNGNIDTDYDQSVSVKANENTVSTAFTKGVATFEKFAQSGTTDFIITAESGGLQSAEQAAVISKIDTILDDDFEQGNLVNWLVTNDWKTSVISPISGKYSLKHNLTNTSGSSQIVKNLGKLSLQTGTTVWRWQIKNGDWNPSSSNNFYYVLASDTQNLDAGISYVVGINRSDSDDLLTLSKVEHGTATVLLTSELLWTENEQVGIEVKLDSKGKWTLAYDNNGGFDNLYMTGTAIDKPTVSRALFTGFVFHYETASRAGLFWADDVRVYHFDTAPQVTDFKVLSATNLEIVLNQDMEKISAETKENYMLNNDVVIQKVELTTTKNILLTVSEMKTNSYKLKLKKLQSTAGIFLADTTLTFDYFAAARPGDVVLNELMIDESPSVQLPEYEYMELFNTTDKPFILTNWTISVGKYEKTLPADTIQPGEYVILCASSAQKALAAYGKVIVVSRFPTLTNTSGTVLLRNADGLEIDKVVYEKAWYNDKTKENGGWSLERIKPESPTNSRANWAASQDERGGTPGEQNSVLGIVLDNTPPILTNVAPSNRNQLQLTFSEAIDSLAVKRSQNFFVNGLGYAETVTVSQDATQIMLTFKENFEYGKIYKLTIEEVIDWFGNTLENAKANFGLPELALPNEIIINEILFNPVSGNVDYLELYNRSDKIFDLATLFIATRDSKNALKSVYVMSQESRLLNPEKFVVLTTNPELIAEQYEVRNPAALLKMKTLPSFPDTEGIVVILNQENTVIDELLYTEKMHLKLLASKEGVSLERINYELPTQDVNNWHSAPQAAGFGTPTYQNSSYSELQSFETDIYIAPKVFSPNGDGIDDNMQMHYEFDSPGHIANVRIFDSNGRLVRDIARNLTLDTRGIIVWDGVNANNERSRTGRYLIFIEIFDEQGNVKTYKKTCVLHGYFK